MAATRVSTIGNIREDGSFQGRLVNMGRAATHALSEPFGLGLGSHGLAARVASKESEGEGDSSGYIESLRTFGWIGFALMVSVLYRSWSGSRTLITCKNLDPNVALFRVWFASGMVALLSGNWLFTATFFWVLVGYVVALSDRLKTSERKPKRVGFYSSKT